MNRSGGAYAILAGNAVGSAGTALVVEEGSQFAGVEPRPALFEANVVVADRAARRRRASGVVRPAGAEQQHRIDR